jgi:hypothetical protein
MPNKAIKPTAADTLRLMPVSQSATRPPIRAKGTFISPEQQDKNQCQTDWHDDGQSFHCPLLILELPTPDDAVTRRQRHLFGDFRHGFLNKTALVAADQVALDGDPPAVVFAADAGGTAVNLDIGQFRQRNPNTCGGSDCQVLKGGNR